MPACQLKPADKKAYISAIGQDLVKHHGKKKYYKPSEVERSARRCDYPVDLDCWAYSFFSSAEDFELLHRAAGEVCDYAAMKAELLTDIVDGASYSVFDLDLSWLEWPDIDLSSVFDWFDLSP